jgi:hypothetical protein
VPNQRPVDARRRALKRKTTQLRVVEQSFGDHQLRATRSLRWPSPPLRLGTMRGHAHVNADTHEVGRRGHAGMLWAEVTSVLALCACSKHLLVPECVSQRRQNTPRLIFPQSMGTKEIK